jgi:hypothetical protein
MSGAGVWVFDAKADKVRPRLVGIAWAHSERVGCIRIVPIREAVRLLTSV